MYIIATISPGDLILIFVLALVVFGPKRLPEVGRQVGTMIRDLKRLSQEFTGALVTVQDQVHETISPVVSNVTGYVTDVAGQAEGAIAPPPPKQVAHDSSAEESPDLMASKAEFGEEQTYRSRRGVVLSTLPPESKGEA